MASSRFIPFCFVFVAIFLIQNASYNVVSGVHAAAADGAPSASDQTAVVEANNSPEGAGAAPASGAEAGNVVTEGSIVKDDNANDKPKTTKRLYASKRSRRTTKKGGVKRGRAVHDAVVRGTIVAAILATVLLTVFRNSLFNGDDDEEKRGAEGVDDGNDDDDDN